MYPCPPPLALDQKTPLRRETAAEDVVDLAGYAAERLGQLLAPQGDDGLVPLGLEELVNVLFDGSDQIGQNALPVFRIYWLSTYIEPVLNETTRFLRPFRPNSILKVKYNQ